MNQVADIYSERVLSRISNSYTIIKLFGDDIRLKKRIH
jgi:DNA replication protein DnaC